MVRESVWISATGRVESSSFHLFVQLGFVQVSQEAAVSVLMRSTFSEGQSKEPGEETESNSRSFSA